ncbi:MAG: MarR family transcriptional regulator [Planctomycetes bacterium]|nr:MarR family transcriptional regulator [Planctomycetota bacterium]
METDSAALFSDLIRLETELWNVVAARLLSEHGLELTWFEPMQVIAREPDCRVHDVVEALSITVGGASKLVDRIEAAGFCRRRENPADRRSSFIDLTPKGKQLLAAASRTFAREVELRLRIPLSPRRFQEFARTILHLRSELQVRQVQK